MSPTLLGQQLTIRTHAGRDLAAACRRLAPFVREQGAIALSRHPAWLLVLRGALGHTPYLLEVAEGRHTRGVLPLAFVRSWLFGRFLVGLPYLNSGGTVADGAGSAR